MQSSKITVAVLSLVLSAVVVAAEPYFGKMGAYVAAPTTVDANIMVLDFTPEIRALADRVQRSMLDNREWLEEYVSKLQPGQAAPYHQNFGVTEPEYQLLLKSSQELSLVPTGSTGVSFGFRDDDTLLISGLPGEPPFDKLIYEPVSDSILSSYGTLTGSEPASGSLGSTGKLAWTGRLWKLERREVNNKVNIGFVIGKLDTGESSILIHEVTGRVNSEPVEYHYMLVWETPRPE